MDFQLYSLGAALVFHEIFFPESSTAMALILAMGTYGAGYVARIVGAFIFGKMGDRIGRKKVLFITITMTESWYPIAIMIMAYSVIGLISALKMPEVKDRDLSALEDAAEDQPRVVRAAQPSRSL